MSHGIKLDWRNLILMFSLSYIKREKDSKKHRVTADSQSIKYICVGNNLKKQWLTILPTFQQQAGCVIRHELDPSIPSGPVFGLPYDENIGLNLYNESSPSIHAKHEMGYVQSDNMPTLQKAKVQPQHIITLNPTPLTEAESKLTKPHTVPHYLWITYDIKVTLQLPSMTTPKQGYIFSVTQTYGSSNLVEALQRKTIINKPP
eukprot:8226260-Ditylum_brightwellii.AAC.1